MEKEESQNKESQNLKDENSELSKDKQAPEDTEKKEEEEQLQVVPEKKSFEKSISTKFVSSGLANSLTLSNA